MKSARRSLPGLSQPRPLADPVLRSVLRCCSSSCPPALSGRLLELEEGSDNSAAPGHKTGQTIRAGRALKAERGKAQRSRGISTNIALSTGPQTHTPLQLSSSAAGCGIHQFQNRTIAHLYLLQPLCHSISPETHCHEESGR